MNKRLMLLGLLFIMAGTGKAQNKGHAATVEIKTHIYCDHCLDCGSCGNRLENAIYKIKGIKRVDINDKEMTLKVVYNPNRTTPAEIRKAIAASGFDADDLKADPEAYQRLDDCCKKPL